MASPLPNESFPQPQFVLGWVFFIRIIFEVISIPVFPFLHPILLIIPKNVNTSLFNPNNIVCMYVISLIGGLFPRKEHFSNSQHFLVAYSSLSSVEDPQTSSLACPLVPRPSRYIYNTISTTKAHGSLLKEGQKDCRSQKNRKSALRLSPRNIRETTPMTSHQHGCLSKTWTMA